MTNEDTSSSVEVLPEPAAPDVDAIEVLLKNGEHAAAAAALWAIGQRARAAAIYEQIFEHDKALKAYEAVGDVEGAMRVALRAADTTALARVLMAAVASGRTDALVAPLLRAGRHAELAQIYEGRGDVEAAARAFEDAGRLDKSAALRAQTGRLRDAGVLYERHLAAHPDDANAALQLGRILARFGRHEDAITALQRAIGQDADPAMVARAAPTMALAFVQMGHEHAARAVVAGWRKAAAQLSAHGTTDFDRPPADLDELLRSERAAGFRAIQEAHKTRPPEPLAGAPTEPAGDVSPDEDGTLLLGGRYLLGEPLGGGGVGQVFRAYDAFTEAAVAVKIFSPQVLRSEAVQSFARETRTVAALQHPAVAPLVELNMAEGFVVTELIFAPTVEDRLRAGGAAGWVAPLVRGLLDLLADIHRAGLVHGGLKPTNVFVLDPGVRVVDVGAHRLLALRSTETGGLAGVWPYLAPEQLFGTTATASSDLYAVAAMLYRALTGSVPFPRVDDDRRAPPPLASSVRPGIAAAWDAFFERALAPKPEDRYPDAQALRGALPELPSDAVLPVAPPLPRASGSASAELHGAEHRYDKQGLVFRDGPVRVYAGHDRSLERHVWLVEADTFDALTPLVAVARLWRGAQSVYDVLPALNRVVVARDVVETTADLASLRAVPQGLVRDLAAVAHALTFLHGEGLALDGFPLERALGPVGPRLRVAPAPLPRPHTPAAETHDWESFGALVDHALALVDDPTLDGRGRVLAMLHHDRLLDRKDLEALGRDAAALQTWPAFLDALSIRLVHGASARVVARWVRDIVRGS